MPRTEEQFREMREKSKTLIMETALELFSNQGFHSTSIQKIAKEAGIAIGLVYNYFKSKEELLDAIIQNGIQEFVHTLHSQVQSSDVLTKENFSKMLTVYFGMIKSRIKIWRLFIKIGLEPGVAQVSHKHIGEFSQHMNVISMRYFEGQGFDDPKAKAAVLNAMLHGAFLSYILHGDEDSFELMKREIIEKFV